MNYLSSIVVGIFSLPVLRTMIRYWPPEFWGNKVRQWYFQHKLYACGQKNWIQEGCLIYSPEFIQLGSRSGIGRFTELNAGPGEVPCLIIGNDTWIGPYCFFRTASHRFDDPDKLFIEQGHDCKKIIIGDDVYIGARAVFLGGAEVGDHSVVAAGSVVSTKYPPYSIIAGNPARLVMKRK